MIYFNSILTMVKSIFRNVDYIKFCNFFNMKAIIDVNAS